MQTGVLEIPCLETGRRTAESRRRRRVFAPREVIFRDNDPVRRVHIVDDGLVMTQHVFSDGRRQIVDLAGPGELFSWEEGPGHGCTAEALTFCTVTSYDMAAVETVPEVQLEVAACLRATVERLQNHIILLGRKTALERVASLILRLASLHEGQRHAARPTSVSLPLTRREIADHLGITQETASRSFSELKRRGAIGYTAANEISIRDPKMLAALSGSAQR